MGLIANAQAYDISGKVLDSAGVPIAQAKVWLLEDSARSVLTDAQGAFRLSNATFLRPMGAGKTQGLGLSFESDGGASIDASVPMILSLSLTTVNGTSVVRRGKVTLSPGRNRLEKVVGELPFGIYALRLDGPKVSLAVRIVQTRAATLGESPQEQGEAVKALPKTAAADTPALQGIVADKPGYCPMLHVPASDKETGVVLTLKRPLSKPGHIIVIYLENWSFNATYGEFPGAEGIAKAKMAPPQRDTNGIAYASLPRPWNDSRFPANLPNQPFLLSNYVGLNQRIPDLVHRFYQQQLQINGTKMDQFVAVSDSRGGTMGYFHTDSLGVASYAKKYVLFDHFFHSAFGGSYLNHQWLIAARTPYWPGVPSKYRAQVDAATGKIRKTGDRSYADGIATPDGFIVNTAHSQNFPHPSGTSQDQLMPPLTYATIGDRMNDKGVTWAWYGGGWKAAVDGNPSSGFPFHHHPFLYFKNYAEGTTLRSAHLKDGTDFWTDLRAGTLPQVVFFKPSEIYDEHPSSSDMRSGDMATKAMLDSIQADPIWNDAIVIVTYDENGGFYDHVPPPVTDRWGPGVRIPAILASPYARKGYVDKHPYETVSILSLIERRFALVPLTARDAAAGDLTTALQLP
jgi:phospholipase C